MDRRRLLRFTAARVLHVLLHLTPRKRHVLVTAWPADEGNAVETVRALLRRYSGSIVWVDAPSAARMKQLGLDPDRITMKAKKTWSAIWSFLTAEAVFFTHGLYGCPRPTRKKTIVDLWHGDGPKSTIGAKIYSTYLVTGSRVFAQSRAEHFDISPENVIVSGLPRIEQLRRPASPHQLSKLGIDSNRPFVLWMPTYRRADGGGLNGAFTDMSSSSVDRGIASAIGPGLSALRDLDIQVVIKPHPSDRVSRQHPGLTMIDDADIREAGTTLYHVLGASGGLVTDYSSVWTDYLALDRPIGFFMPDLDRYLEGRGVNPPDTLEHLPGAMLRTVNDFHDFGRLVLGPDREPGATSRKNALDHFELVHPDDPADNLLEMLQQRGVLTLRPPGH